jgi:hypothetical protein
VSEVIQLTHQVQLRASKGLEGERYIAERSSASSTAPQDLQFLSVGNYQEEVIFA